MGDNTVKIALKLLLITLVAGLALGLTNAVTKDPIQEQELAAAEAARREVLTADSFYEVPLDTLKAESSIQWAAGNDTVTAVYGAKAADGSFAGTVVEITGKGYGGSIAITVGVDQHKQVSGVKIGTHSETPGLGAKTANPDFYGQYAGMDAQKEIAIGAGENGVVAISGATVSSKAVTSAVNIAATLAVEYQTVIEEAAQ